MHESELYTVVRRLAEVMQALQDEDLEREWTWRDHDEGLRFALLGTYHELRDLAVSLASGRLAEGFPISAAQQALGQYHAAYRDLEATLLGIGDDDLDRPPAEDEWALREVLGHMIGGDRVFFALIHVGLEKRRAGEEPARLSAEDMEALFGPREEFDRLLENEGLAGIFDYHAAIHNRILHGLSGLSDDELTAPTRFWEPEMLSVQYRLHRLDAHLRQHTIQVEKTIAAIGSAPSEARRLLRLVYNALAEVEGGLIGAWDYGPQRQHDLVSVISARSDKIETIVKP